MTIALGWFRALPVIYAMMMLGGAAWVFAMTELNVAAQLSVPQWVQGRALSCYQIVLQGGMALGAILWGAVAERWRIPNSMYLAALTMVLGMVTMLRYRLTVADDLVLDPLPLAPIPNVAPIVKNESGPVLVTIEYAIDPTKAADFEEAMMGLRTIRRRDGATFWGLFFDATNPERYIEVYVVDSWIEHMRQHGRATVADQYIQDRVRGFQLDGVPMVVNHQIAAQYLRDH
jgi:MFS family permease